MTVTKHTQELDRPGRAGVEVSSDNSGFHITREMRLAGSEVLLDDDLSLSAEEKSAEVYRAMENARIERAVDRVAKTGPQHREGAKNAEAGDAVTARLSEITRRPKLRVAESLAEVRLLTET